MLDVSAEIRSSVLTIPCIKVQLRTRLAMFLDFFTHTSGMIVMTLLQSLPEILDCIREFNRISESTTDVYGLSYDYGSIMHYVELRPTIIAKNEIYQETMGSELLAFSDIYKINEHYECNKICRKSTSAKCANEGFPHPRDCSICICPGGYGGALCDQRVGKR
ncbi:Astacin (Peptidase M12A) [Parelaphostrongylus tenuis]|uniref:Astacin (Peptidase M12A) n=1 Tax=Parelaphostrongylus tenuis TaxID=148309 RepID=A0AAD5RAI7_PARTN|nr:Astacin (Peptidase M12A) [Parelaphostrongylus tenuis]